MFSIIIPLYNKAPYIAKAIQSVAAQTYQEFELIVIDDGSTDNSLAEAQKALSKLTPPFGGWRAVKKKNEGVSVTRNKGVELAKYDYIAFLDADDWWEPTYLEEMKALMDEFPDAGIYASAYYIAKNGSKRLARIGVDANFTTGYIDYFKVYAKTLEMPVWTGASIINKKIFTQMNGFIPEIKLGEDFHLWVRIASENKVAFLNKHLSNYNQDVDVTNRAVNEKFYQPSEHFIFADYSTLQNNPDFIRLFDLLAVYGLLPYYLAKKNQPEVDKVLRTIHWNNQALKYRLFYRVLPRIVVNCWFKTLKIAAKYKRLVVNQRGIASA